MPVASACPDPKPKPNAPPGQPWEPRRLANRRAMEGALSACGCGPKPKRGVQAPAVTQLAETQKHMALPWRHWSAWSGWRVHSFGIRPRVAGPNEVYIHEKGGTAGRPTGPCFLACVLSCLLDETPNKEPPSKNRHSQKERRKTQTTCALQKVALVGLSAPHGGARTENRRFRGPGQRARAAAGTAAWTAVRAERTMASVASSESSDGELLKQFSF